MTLETSSDDAQLGAPAIVVFGLDDGGRPHASSFKSDEVELAQKAAGLMGLHVLQLTTPEHHTTAAKLPVGRVFASGKAFVPFVGKPLYEAAWREVGRLLDCFKPDECAAYFRHAGYASTNG